MKQKKQLKKRKPITEIDARKDYSGEASPYWDHLENNQRITEEGNPEEDAIANPDVLSEDDTLYARPISEEGQIRLQAIHETLPHFSAQQKSILHLCADLGWTEGRAADSLGITRSAVHSQMIRMREKIKRQYDRLKAAGE